LWGTARSLTDLGYTASEQGDHLAAHEAYREALAIFAGLAHRRGIARALEGSACLALAEGHAARALTLAAAAATLRNVIRAPLPQTEQVKLDHALLPAWESLNEEERRHAWEKGSAISLEEAIQYSLDGQRAVTPLSQDQ
jgi:hypothetical protein